MKALGPERYTVTDSGCWEWNGYRSHLGYGQTGGGGAHRRMYEQVKGPIPAGKELDHTCVNPPCVNPDHLDAVTRAEHIARTMDRLGKNDLHRTVVAMRQQGFKLQEIADALGYGNKASVHAAIQYALEKGLVDPGDIPRRNLVTDADRAAMTARYQAGETQTAIAREYGLHSSQVSRIVRGLRSGHSIKRLEAAS